MEENKCEYKKIRQWRDDNIMHHISSNDDLNEFHHNIMNKVLTIALNHTKEKFGSPPSEFSWFVMGSGGRFEQALVSDQDHGLIYEDTRSDTYFKVLGKEITKGLLLTGYPYCDGNVMSSNLLWCKSIEEWRTQVIDWMEEASWDSIRYLLIFYDAKSIIGDGELVLNLKQLIYNYIKENPEFLTRLSSNTMRIQKGIGFLGQFLTETHGSHTGSIHIKNYGFFPYVNAVRLLAIKENIKDTSTLSRLQKLSKLPHYKIDLNKHQNNFEKLLNYRLSGFQIHDNYEDIHFLKIKELNRKQKKELKQILKDVVWLHKYIQNIILKGK